MRPASRPGRVGSTPPQLPPRRPGSGLGIVGFLHQLTRQSGKASRRASTCSGVMSMPPMKSCFRPCFAESCASPAR